MKDNLKKLNQAIIRYNRLSDDDTKLVKCLHDMRVAARKSIVVMSPEDSMTLSLKKLIQSSNKIRDLDVFLNEILPKLPKKWHAELDNIRQPLILKRLEMNQDFRIVLKEEWLNDLSQIENFSSDKRSLQYDSNRHQMTHKEIEKSLKKALKELKSIELEDKHLHKIRLVIKRLHYQLERFYPDEKQLLKLTKLIQTELGEFHDFYQAVKLLKQHEALISPKTYQHGITFLKDKKSQTISNLRKALRKMPF
ncbi:hypothetical protein THMIRHAM_02290 [Thiomicrorhabdus immobilis]|uniref:CHAD domain-containing protein n=1 Tax=Thiomicrorhabdus immobilis TaxID=2791037 RepID=A0ABM7MAT2_9GAMM|nr:CHAD domain-containing protein [Thiomicrorhabdus immobilis]BCN92444.1 hypothetical protein THMIRHAM_02290 [Thiomicrorhabdus immobilis]